MLAGAFGIPVTMLSGDTAACKEIHQLVPQAECAEVKSGVSRTAASALRIRRRASLIREKRVVRWLRLAEYQGLHARGAGGSEVQFTPKGTQTFEPAAGPEQLDERTWVFAEGHH